MVHNVVEILGFAFDDSYDGFFPQGSSQWDALNHVGHPEYGYYNGRTAADVTAEPPRNGIEHWARRGIVGRGVLLDVPAYLEQEGRPIDGGELVEFSVADLEATREWAGIEYQSGDILLVRSGWMAWYEELSADARREMAEDSFTRVRSPGLAAGEEMAAYLWDSHVAAVASDNSALEAWPHAHEVGSFLHFDLLPLLGLAIGELWYLEGLAADCAADRRYEFLLTSAPLYKRGGVGSPPNALAIK